MHLPKVLRLFHQIIRGGSDEHAEKICRFFPNVSTFWSVGNSYFFAFSIELDPFWDEKSIFELGDFFLTNPVTSKTTFGKTRFFFLLSAS